MYFLYKVKWYVVSTDYTAWVGGKEQGSSVTWHKRSPVERQALRKYNTIYN